MNRLRMLVVDGSATYRKMFARAAVELDKGAVVASVTESAEALDKVRRNDYDIVVIDVEVTGLFALLNGILLQIPKAYILVSARPSSASEELCAKALAEGAAECLTKPIHSSYNDNYNVVKQKMEDIINALLKKNDNDNECADSIYIKKNNSISEFRPGIVLIAASTGGPMALEKILPKLSKDFPIPILIVQHMLLQFTESLAYNLNQKALIRVKVADDRECVGAGTVYIAPGGSHMKLDAENRILLDCSPPINGVRPAADALFFSVAESYTGTGVLAIILTGMGRDGEKGLSMLKEKQECYCFAQSEESCVVYGMPRAAVESGYADMVLALDRIPVEMECIAFPRKRDE